MSGDQGDPRLKRVSLGDLVVTYREAGEGSPVVLVHGLAQDHRMWDVPQRELVSWRTLAYDVRGHGGTSLGKPDGTLAQLGGDLIAFLERFGPARCVGFSLGGTVALWAAAERPNLVPAVLALATSSVVGRAAAGFFRDRIELFDGGDDAAVRAAVTEDTLGQLSGAEADLEGIVADRMEAIGDRGGYMNAARAMAAMNADPLNERLRKITSPVLVVSGENDAFCPRKAADIMLEYLPDGRFVELPGVGHLVTDTDPEAVTAVMREWLTKGDE